MVYILQYKNTQKVDTCIQRRRSPKFWVTDNTCAICTYHALGTRLRSILHVLMWSEYAHQGSAQDNLSGGYTYLKYYQIASNVAFFALFTLCEWW
jgi:hypothetical protein